MLWRSRQSPDLLILTQAQTLAMTTVAAQPEPHKGTAVGPPDPVVVARMLTQRGELAPNGRPWYDELYLNGAGSCCGAIFRLYIWPFIVLPHYLLVSDVIERGKVRICELVCTVLSTCRLHCSGFRPYLHKMTLKTPFFGQCRAFQMHK